MHQALYIQEILYIIFSHRRTQRFKVSPGDRSCADILSLARTCKAFKEPALDVLWMNVCNLSQLVRCLPGACSVKRLENGKRIYVLQRNLEPEEVTTLQAYARRVRDMVISSEDYQAHPDTLMHLCQTSQMDSEPLFPNLRLLHLGIGSEHVIVPLLRHVAVQNLRGITLFFFLSDPSSYEDFIRSLSSSCPRLQDICVQFFGRSDVITFSDIMNRNLHCWTRLQSITCPTLIMDMDTFFHLSRMPSLTQLSLTLGSALFDQIKTSNHVFVFPALQHMTLHITSMVPDSEFFTHIRLPALESVSMHYSMSPPRDMISSFAMALRTACNTELVMDINLDGSVSLSPLPTTLSLEDVLHFAAFNLTYMQINVNWIIDMKDNDLLRLAADCPQIKLLFINNKFGWRSAGITPTGLLQVFRICPSLETICIALDTRAYQVLPQDQPKSQILIDGRLGDPLPSWGFRFIQLADSVIEAESVPALAEFFANCMPSDDGFGIFSWAFDPVVKRRYDNWEVYQRRWEDVARMAKEMIVERSKRANRRQIKSV